MNDYHSSHYEGRAKRLYEAAQKGFMNSKDFLYSKEIKELQKRDGLIIRDVKVYTKSTGLLIGTFDWSEAFFDGTPCNVFYYISHMSETFPSKSIDNFAQELYVIAQRNIRGRTY